MSSGAWRIELEPRKGRPDPVGKAARKALAQRGLSLTPELTSGRGFLLPSNLSAQQVEHLTQEVLADPVVEEARILAPGEIPELGAATLVVRRRAGVADPEGQTACRAFGILEIPVEQAESYRWFRVEGQVDPGAFLNAGGRALANPTIEEVCLGDRALALHPQPNPRPSPRREVPILEMDGAALVALSRSMALALSQEEMEAIQSHYRQEGREPTDVELETFAQTWSEHCKHKTLTGPVRLVVRDENGAELERREFQNLLKETVFEATRRLSPDWCWSVFEDNAGVVAFTDDIGIAVKVETHNHPSALEPYGGAGTGIGGVIRDILGTGLGARPFAATDVFCVGPEKLPFEQLPPGCLHPDRVLEGVIAGVRDYGNRMGIPTVSGTVLRHPGYTANPLVFAGCIGELPRDCVHKEVLPGDKIVAIGGRTGRDGIHGATFSSEALHEESESVDATAVQIGDPITEKKVLDLMMAARDRRLYRAVTDCGAGGFSSAIGEMGEGRADRGLAGGAVVELSAAPLKYAGLGYDEIWISEAQERMVLAVPPEHEAALLQLCESYEVEAVVLGEFTDSGRLQLLWHGEEVGDMAMDFLHGGVPQPQRSAEVIRPTWSATPWPKADEIRSREDLLAQVLAHPAVVSKEWVVRQYDHEVQGGTARKPYQGPAGRGPGDGTVLKPRLELPGGVAIGCGLAPRIALVDPYAGTACAIDEAIRNVVAAGGTPHQVAILDNFCWGDCRKADRLGSLVRAAEACRDAALAYGAPFISGKDSLNNEYRVGDQEVAIPPTLLCTAVAPVADVNRASSTFFKAPGNLLILVGETGPEGGGSALGDVLQWPDSPPPCPDFDQAPAVFDAVHRILDRGLAVSCHDLAEGGLAVAVSEMALGGGFGAILDLARVPVAAVSSLDRDQNAALRLFSETPTRFLLEVAEEWMESVAEELRTLRWASIGMVCENQEVEFLWQADSWLEMSLSNLAQANGMEDYPQRKQA